MATITKISTGFLEGNLIEGMDPERYAESLRAHLEAAYPGVEIEIPWEANASGCTPYPLQTSVTFDDPSEDPNTSLLQEIEEEIIAHDGIHMDDGSLYRSTLTVQMVDPAKAAEGYIEYRGDAEDLEGWLDDISDYTPTIDSSNIRGWNEYTHTIKLTPDDPDIPALYYLVTEEVLPRLGLHLVGLGDIAGMAGVPTDTASKWQRRGVLPQPMATTSAGRVWDRATIAAWLTNRGYPRD